MRLTFPDNGSIMKKSSTSCSGFTNSYRIVRYAGKLSASVATNRTSVPLDMVKVPGIESWSSTTCYRDLGHSKRRPHYYWSSGHFTERQHTKILITFLHSVFSARLTCGGLPRCHHPIKTSSDARFYKLGIRRTFLATKQ